jgi:DNA polymerase-1
MAPEGSPGGLLVLADYPSKTEDTAERPLISPAGSFVRGLVSRWWKGPVAYDTALRCAPTPLVAKDKLKEKHTEACRPYLAHTLHEVRPTRILAMGSWAAHALLGRKVPVTQVRRGVGWWIDDLDGDPDDTALWVPVYLFHSPHLALRNTQTRALMERDVRWALEGPIPDHNFVLRTYRTVETVEDALACEAELRGAPWCVADVETSGIQFEDDFRVECITVWRPHMDPHQGWLFDRAQIEDPATRAVLLRVFAAHRWVGANFKFDTQAIRSDPLLGLWIDIYGDTRIWSKLLHGGESSGKLAVYAEQVGMGGHKAEAADALDLARKDLGKLVQEPFLKPLKPTKKNPTGARPPYMPTHIMASQGGDPTVPARTLENLREGRAAVDSYAYRYMGAEVRGRYCARDGLATTLCAEDYHARVYAAPHLVNVWEGVQRGALKAFARMEAAGVAFDPAANHALSAYVQGQLAQVDARLAPYFPDAHTPEELAKALNTPAVLAKVLFTDLKLPRVKETPTGAASTDADVLEELEGRHPIVADIREHRRYAYVDSHYGAGMRAHVRRDGRVHTEFLPDGAGTGRVSSSNPNLQNLPSPEKEPVILGVMARNQFIAPPGYLLLSGDYSQIELRVAAMLSGDPLMTQLFVDGQDFHRATARLTAPQLLRISEAAFDLLPEDQVKVARRRVKEVNFGLLYGKTAPGLAEALGCTIPEAEAVMHAVLGKFSKLQAWIRSTIDSARRNGGVYAYWNGKIANWRPLPAIGEQGTDKRAIGIRRNAENAAVNTPIQGTAAHYTTASLYPIQEQFDAEGLDARVISTVHDETLVEVREAHADAAQALMREVMLSHYAGAVPLAVDFKRGVAYGALKAAA